MLFLIVYFFVGMLISVGIGCVLVFVVDDGYVVVVWFMNIW